MKNKGKSTVLLGDEQMQKDLEEQVLSPMADQLIQESPQSSLEKPEQRKKRLIEQLRHSLRSYQDGFGRSIDLLKEANFRPENADKVDWESLAKNWKKDVTKTLEAGDFLQDICHFTDEDMHQIYDIAADHYSRKGYGEARDLFVLLTTLRPDNAHFFTGLAMAEQMNGHFDTAATFYAIAADIPPHDPKNYLYAANCLHHMKRHDVALQVLDQIIEGAGNDKELHDLKQQAVQLKQEWKKMA